MDKFVAKSICILGRQPELGLAELESLYGAEHVRPLESCGLLDIPAEDINFKRLGGTIKTARILSELDSTDWKYLTDYLLEKIPEHLEHVPEGKFTLGISAYGLSVDVAEINRAALKVKQAIKKTGRPVRIVPNKAPALNSAQVLHNKLTYQGAWELLLIKNGAKTLLAQTLFVQDIEAYAARDQARPHRDSRVGMLPPKLAQIILNLAVSQTGQQAEDKSKIRVLDPFCGTGVVLQEALLAGFSVLGTDNDPRMVEYTKKNLQWLVNQQPSIEGSAAVELADATEFCWPGFTVVASEVFLGRPLNFLPPPDKLKQIVADVNLITKKFLKNLTPQLKPDRTICLAVPAWRQPGGQLVHLPVIDQLTDMGYNYSDLKHVRHDQLVYFREDQVVARQLLRLEKADK